MTNSDLTATPSSFDWSVLGSTTTPVNDQGHCGSCWAYSTTEGNVTYTRGQRLHHDGLITLTTELTPTCLFDGSFSQSVSPRCITMKFVSQLVGLPCVFHPCLLRGSRPLASRLICIVLSVISRLSKLLSDCSGTNIKDSEWDSSQHCVDTVCPHLQFTSLHAERVAQSHEHIR